MKKYMAMRIAADLDGLDHIWFQEFTEDMLRELHSYDLDADSHYSEKEKKVLAEEYGWEPTPESFDEWLSKAIADGFVVEKGA